MNTPPVPRLTADTCSLAVIDVQDKLLAKFPDAAGLVGSVAFLLDAAALVGVPAFATEQYPKGLGPTSPDLARRLPADIPPKTAFTGCGAAGFLQGLQSARRPNVVLAGIESHVCVSQTAFDLLDAGFRVFLPVDAIGSRHRLDHDTALDRLTRTGCVPTTAEAVAFEWVGDAGHPQFKAFSRLVIARDAARA